MKKIIISFIIVFLPLIVWAQTLQIHRGNAVINYETHLIDSISFTQEDYPENSNEGNLLKEVTNLEEEKNSLIRVFTAWDKRETGKWSTSPTKEISLSPMFTIYDDDVADKYSPTSYPSSYNTQGYFSVLFPLLKSLSVKYKKQLPIPLRACLAAEGQRIGFTSSPPRLTENGQYVKKLHDKAGWEIACHSMTARYYADYWLVDSLNSSLAKDIMANGNWYGKTSGATTGVYCLADKKNYVIKEDKSGWEELPRAYYRMYVRDWKTKKVVMYNPTFPIDYQLGEWRRIADELNYPYSDCWIGWGATESGQSVSECNKYFKYGFDFWTLRGSTLVNTPPLTSTIHRTPIEQLGKKVYIGQEDPDNIYDMDMYNAEIKLINEAVANNGWIVWAFHTYRPCWYNWLDGKNYNKEWIVPLNEEEIRSIDENNYWDNPPKRLGISNWGEWVPCEGTKLKMLYDIFSYAVERGMLNVTGYEGAQKMSNVFSSGIYTKGDKYDLDKSIQPQLSNYPHLVIGVNGAIDYYNP